MATDKEMCSEWKNMGGDHFGSISSSSDEIFINLHQLEICQLQSEQIWVIWTYFRYIAHLYPRASLSLFEDSHQDQQCIYMNLDGHIM